MNRYVAFVPIAILILGGPGIVSQAFAVTVMTIETDKQVYDHASTIILSGNVYPVDLRGSEVTIVCKSPAPGICGVFQLKPDSNGDFSVEIKTQTAMMKYDGMYQFDATYSNLASATTSIELVDAIASSESPESPEIGTAVTGTSETSETDDVTFYRLGAGQIEYDMTCDADPAFFANADDDSIVIHLEPKSDGIITLTLHEELIKPFEDGTFAVIINNQEMEDFTQVGNTLTIPCLIGTEKIEIHGSWAIPEFGVIAAMILAVAIVSIIVITAKTRLSIVPRY